MCIRDRPSTIWHSRYALNGLKLELGAEVLVKGWPDFYGPFGKLSFIAQTIELVGEGALKKAYDKLKEKLAKEGLFAESRKRPLPLYPKTIGVITSTSGAVVHDFNSNLGKYGFKVKIMGSRVEGQESGPDLILSLRAFKSVTAMPNCARQHIARSFILKGKINMTLSTYG